MSSSKNNELQQISTYFDVIWHKFSC